MTTRSDVLAYVHIMKTGGQTMCDILRQSFPGRHCDIQVKGVATADDLRFARRFYPHLQSIAGHGVVPLSDLGAACDSIRFFAFVRDPVERCISHYQYRRNKDETSVFEPWLIAHANYQTRFLCRTHDARDPWAIPPDADRAIEVVERRLGFVGLQERFDESLLLLRRWVADARLDIEYRSRNVARSRSMRDQLLGDAHSVAMIKAHHEHDAKLYCYVRDVVYPRQVQSYGPGLEEDLDALRRGLPAPQKRLLARALASVRRGMLYKPLARRRPRGRGRGLRA